MSAGFSPKSEPTPSPFPNETAWSTILAARDRSSPEAKVRFERLVAKYWEPVWWFLVRRWNCSKDDAADLTQEFFARLYDSDFLQQTSPERGRFRTFLKLKLRDLVIDDLRRKSAQKRGGHVQFVHIDRAPGNESTDLRWPGLSPEEEFDRVWASCVMTMALKELEERLKAEGKESMFKAFWSCTIAHPPKSSQECAEELGLKEKDVRNYVFRIRREFRDVLLRYIRDSVEREDDVDPELSYILDLFRR